jgi:hypothetical protein
VDSTPAVKSEQYPIFIFSGNFAILVNIVDDKGK